MWQGVCVILRVGHGIYPDKTSIQRAIETICQDSDSEDCGLNNPACKHESAAPETLESLPAGGADILLAMMFQELKRSTNDHKFEPG